MRRRADELDGCFDLLVVGGGIYGAWTAWDAALRGLRVALVEAGDWAGGTSSASSKLIHGGLRYLEHGWFGLVRRTLGERQRLLRLAPHRVRPLRFAIPLGAGLRRPAWQLGIGLWLYDRLASARPGEGAARLDPCDAAERLPWLHAPDGALTYLDAQEDDARMVLELVDGAILAGAVAVNRATVRELLVDAAGGAAGALVDDGCSGRTCEVRAACTVLAAGPWAGGLLPEGLRPAVRHTQGVHALFAQPPGGMDHAALLTHPRDGRVFFAIPWYGRALVGTTDTDHPGPPQPAAVGEADLDYLVEGLAARCPAAGWSRAGVIGTFAGLRTLLGSRAAPSAASREWALAEPRSGLLLPLGGKYTSARAEAALIVDRVLARLGRPVGPSPTASRPLPWSPAEPWGSWLDQAIAACAAHGIPAADAVVLAGRHGTRLAEVLARCAADPALARPLVPDLPFIAAELAQAREREMALDDDDVFRRRVPLRLLAPACLGPDGRA